MCKPKAPVIDNTPAIQAQQEAAQARSDADARAARIAQGTTDVNNTFDTTFNPGFFSARRQATLDTYTPDLTHQFSEARSQLAIALARAGILGSSEAARQQGLLQTSFDNANNDVALRAEKDVTDLRNSVNNQKASVLADLGSTADPGAAANAALARSQTLQATPVSYSPLGDIFAGVGSGIGNIVSGLRANSIINAFQTTGAPKLQTGAGASTVVR